MRDVFEFMDWVWETHEPTIREVVEDLATVGTGIARCIFGTGLGDNDKGKEGHATVAALVGIVLAHTGTLVAAVQQTDLTRIGFVWLYFFATLIPLISMNVMVRATAVESPPAAEGNAAPKRGIKKRKRHFFDKPTVRMGQVALAVCLLLWVLYSVQGFQNKITGQASEKFTTLKIHAVEDQPFKDGTTGLVARSNLDESIDRILLTVTEEPLLRNDWDVWNIALREGTAEHHKKGEAIDGRKTRFEAQEEFTFDIRFRNFREPGKKYFVEVQLHRSPTLVPDEHAGANRKAAKAAIMEDKGISIVRVRTP